MAEDTAFAGQQNRYRGSRYPGFTSGPINSQGNTQNGIAVNANPGLLDSQAGGGDAPSPGLTATSPALDIKPLDIGKTLSNAAISAALPYAGTQIGAGAGAALAGGASFGEAAQSGFSQLGSKVGGLLNGGASEAGSAAGSAAAGGASAGLTDVGVNVAPELGGSVGSAASDAGASFSDRLFSGSNLGGAAGAGLGSAAATLLTGGNIGQAAKSGVGSAAGFALGNAVLPGLGGVVGGALGGIIGGRVICTELVRQGYLTAKDQRLDMQFTFHALTNIHARGYLYWARNWTRRMARSRKATEFTHRVVVWRLDEIKYQLGINKKPCWPGKIVRWTMEPLCYLIGLMLSDTVETRIYKKEIAKCSLNPA